MERSTVALDVAGDGKMSSRLTKRAEEPEMDLALDGAREGS